MIKIEEIDPEHFKHIKEVTFPKIKKISLEGIKIILELGRDIFEPKAFCYPKFDRTDIFKKMFQWEKILKIRGQKEFTKVDEFENFDIVKVNQERHTLIPYKIYCKTENINTKFCYLKIDIENKKELKKIQNLFDAIIVYPEFLEGKKINEIKIFEKLLKKNDEALLLFPVRYRDQKNCIYPPLGFKWKRELKDKYLSLTICMAEEFYNSEGKKIETKEEFNELRERCRNEAIERIKIKLEEIFKRVEFFKNTKFPFRFKKDFIEIKKKKYLPYDYFIEDFFIATGRMEKYVY